MDDKLLLLIFIEDKKETSERKKNKKVGLEFVITENQRILKVIGKLKLKKKVINLAELCWFFWKQ